MQGTKEAFRPVRLPLAHEARSIDRKWRPHYVIWEVTLRCDLSCAHCSSRAGHARDDELSTGEELALVDELADLGLEEVILIGGEAYLRSDWLDIVRAIRGRGMRCTMVTGGRAFSDDLAQAGHDAGLQSVSVSVDGLAPEHDALRGARGGFDAAMRAIASVRRAKMQASANTQIGRANLRTIPALFERLMDAGIEAWQLQITVAMGRAADHPELLLEPYQMLEVLRCSHASRGEAMRAESCSGWGTTSGTSDRTKPSSATCFRGATGALAARGAQRWGSSRT
jgi:MoaA/NifB/PqqE/SkfB family radical SAM enzyme